MTTNKTLASISFFGFILSLAVNISALLKFDVLLLFPYLWGLHVGIFFVFFPFVWKSRKEFKVKPTFSELKNLLPMWSIICCFSILLYAFLNFTLFITESLQEGGTPAIQHGKYVLQNHGHFIKDITLAQYNALKLNEVRGFSGHWMFFYFLTFAYFGFKKNNTDDKSI